MLKILRTIGIAFLLPGLIVLGYSLWSGSNQVLFDGMSFWGVPVALFVFWVGLAYAGSLLSCVFLVLGAQLDRRTVTFAELSTLCCLVLAVIFPLIHLGCVREFYLDSQGFFCIAIYGLLASLLFVNHLKAQLTESFKRVRKPLTWILLPLIFWTHGVLCLEFRNAFLPVWNCAFIPVHTLVGIFYSGLAMMNGLLCAEGFRVRMLERLMMVVSWFMAILLFWNFLLSGSFATSVFVLAVVIPQLWWVSAVRDSRLGRLVISLCILVAVFIERLCLASSVYENGVSSLSFVDLGVISFSVGLFLLLFYGLRRWVGKYLGGISSYFGELDGSEMEADISKTETQELGEHSQYEDPFSSREFKMLRLPVLVGVAAVLIFMAVNLNGDVNLEKTFLDIVPLTYPLFALVSGLLLFVLERKDK